MSKKSGIRNYKELTTELEKIKEAPKKVLDKTLTDVKKRGPSWVAAEVSKVYGIKKAEVNKGAGHVKVEGQSWDTLRLIYSGRTLTPTHFSMSPKIPKADGGSYTLKASIVKDKRATLGKVKANKKQKNRAGNFRGENPRKSDHSPIMLMRTGNTREGGTDYIPFQRKSTDRKDIEAIKTVSVPQMVSGARTSAGIRKALDEGIDKRLEHYMSRYMGK